MLKISPVKADAEPTDLSAAGWRALARTSNSSQEGRERLTGPCWKETGCSNSSCPVSLQRAWESTGTRGCFVSWCSNAEGGLELAAASPRCRDGGRERRAVTEDAHIYLQEMMESDCKQDEGLCGRRCEGTRQASCESAFQASSNPDPRLNSLPAITQ